MPIERVDINLPSALPADVVAAVSQNRLATDEKIAEADKEAAARKAAEKKVAEKKAEIKEHAAQRETFQRQTELQQRMQQILGGAAGADAASALATWGNNTQLQGKLTEAQKSLFREVMAQNPAQAAQAGQALDRLSKQAGFHQAISNAQQMGTLHAGILENPAAERSAAALLQQRFMQSPKADAATKNQFLRFGLQQAAKGNLEATHKAGDLLGSLAGAGVPRSAQRAAMAMVQRQAGDTQAMTNVVDFVQHRDVRVLPSFARGKATELLAKANGRAEVREGFEQLAADPKFKVQTAQNKGRFFATVGTGRSSEYRALTDQSLVALRSADFPSRAGQVTKFLGKMAAQVQKGGAQSVEVQTLIKEAKKSPLPASPKLQSTVGLSEEDVAKVRAQNRAQILHYFHQLERLYESGEKKLKQAKYLEDVNALQSLREPPPADTSSLAPEERVLYDERSRAVSQRRAQVLKLQQQRSRELRTKRMPPAKRRALLAERRAIGRQPRYFSPAHRVSETPVAVQALGSDAAARLGNAPIPVQAHVENAVARLGAGPISAEKARHVAQVIAQHVAQQVVKQVTEQLLAGVPATPAAASQVPDTSPPTEHTQSGKVDGWGIQRTFDRDLGGERHAVVKPRIPHAAAVAAGSEQGASEVYTGRMLVKDASSVRPLDELFVVSWKSLRKLERVLLQNLGWTQQVWDTKDTRAGKWPVAMATAFVSLTPVQREAVRKLGLSPHAWDERVQALAMGKRT